MLVGLDNMNVSMTNERILYKLYQVRSQGQRRPKILYLEMISDVVSRIVTRTQVSFKDDNSYYRVSCSDVYSKFYRSADPPRVTRPLSHLLRWQQKHQPAHAGVPRAKAGASGSSASQLPSVALSTHGRVRNCETWSLSKNSPESLKVI